MGDHEVLDDEMAPAVRALVRLSKMVESVLTDDGLSVSQFRILDRLVTGSTHGRSLAEWLAVKPPSVTTLVDGLVKRGLVGRREDELDRRQTTHTVTTAGRRLHREVSHRISARLTDVLSSLGDRQADAAIRSLASVNAALDAAQPIRAGRAMAQ